MILKSDITFYEVPGNTNGKMSLQVYIDQILEPVVTLYWRRMVIVGMARPRIVVL